jgi:hypothetical protein
MPQSAHRYSNAAVMAADLDTFLARTGGDRDMPQQAQAFIEEMFPGERGRREAWMRRLNSSPG